MATRLHPLALPCYLTSKFEFWRGDGPLNTNRSRNFEFQRDREGRFGRFSYFFRQISIGFLCFHRQISIFFEKNQIFPFFPIFPETLAPQGTSLAPSQTPPNRLHITPLKKVRSIAHPTTRFRRLCKNQRSGPPIPIFFKNQWPSIRLNRLHPASISK